MNLYLLIAVAFVLVGLGFMLAMFLFADELERWLKRYK